MNKSLNDAINDIVTKETNKATNGINTSIGVMNIVMEEILQSVKAELTAQIKKQFYQIDFTSMVNELIKDDLTKRISNIDFPKYSIPGKSVDPNDLQLSADNIKGGTITGFTSSGIEDKASEINLTIMDRFVVVEKKLVTKELNVLGTTTLDGDVIIKGEIPTDSKVFKNLVSFTKDDILKTLNETITGPISDSITEQLTKDGLDLNQITINGKTAINDNSLGSFIVDSRLQTVGHLKELQVTGETLLSGSLYTSKNRVGINTIEPSSALAVWDEEVEVVLGKHKSQTGYIGSARMQDIAIGCNNKPHITLTTDGNTTIEKLTVGKTSLGSAKVVPKDPGSKGDIRFNEDPLPGYSIGWVCLGGTRWMSFGKIE